MLSSIPELIQNLRANPVDTLINLLIVFAAILICLMIHECAHGYMALLCGDPTAKLHGRLTFDPRKHLDPVGTLCMLFLRIGWAKPVPINPRYFRKYRRDYILVSCAGIIVNLILFVISTVLMVLFLKYAGIQYLSFPFFTGWKKYLFTFIYYLAQMNLGLAVFNLLPVPPLDGFRLLDQFAFNGRLSMNRRMMQIVQLVFLVACLTGLLNGLLSRVSGTIFSAVYSAVDSIL